MSIRDLATKISNLTPEEVAQAMETMPTDVLEFAVRFEALAFTERETTPGPVTKL